MVIFFTLICFVIIAGLNNSDSLFVHCRVGKCQKRFQFTGFQNELITIEFEHSKAFSQHEYKFN